MTEMAMKEKLVELLDDIQQCGEDFTDYEIYGMRLPCTVSNEDVADRLIANGVTVQDGEDNKVPTKWISVKDRLPEIGRRMLTLQSRYGEPFIYIDQFCGDGEWLFSTYKVTHWMPLPQPPKEVSDNGC